MRLTLYAKSEIRMTLKLLRTRLPSEDSTPCPMLAPSLLITNVESHKRESPNVGLLSNSSVVNASLVKGVTIPTMDPIQIKIRAYFNKEDAYTRQWWSEDIGSYSSCSRNIWY